jgi:DnaJ domain
MTVSFGTVTSDAALQILRLGRDASRSQIKEAYRDLAKIFHPDRFQDDPRVQAKAEAEFKQLIAAYEALKSYRPSVVRAAPASPRKARPHPQAAPPPPKEAEAAAPPRTASPDPRSARKPEQRARPAPAPPSASPRIIIAGVVIWGMGVMFGVLLGFALLSQACSEPSLGW